MKKLQKLAALLAALALVLALAGCGASAGQGAPMEAPQGAVDGWAGENGMAMDTESTKGDPAPESEAVAGRKIIYTAGMELESTDFETTCTQLLKAVERAGGYIQSSSRYGSEEHSSRGADYIFRIPTANYKGFLHDAQSAGNPTYLNEDTQDVTSHYVDVEARLSSLESQRDRLLELREQAQSLEDLLAIEDQLTQVQYELESYQGQKKLLDDQIDLSTVNVTVREVRIMTPDAKNFGARLSTAFTRGWTNFGRWLQDFAVGLVANLPWLLLWAAIIAVAVAAVRRHKSKSPAGPRRERRRKKDAWSESVSKASEQDGEKKEP